LSKSNRRLIGKHIRLLILIGPLLASTFVLLSAPAQVSIRSPSYEGNLTDTSDAFHDGLRNLAVEHRVAISDDGSKSYYAELELWLPEEITDIIERDSKTQLSSFELLDATWTDEGEIDFHLVLPADSGGRMRLLAPRGDQPARKLVELPIGSGERIQYELLSAKTIGKSGNRMLASTLRIRLPKMNYHVLITLAVSKSEQMPNIDRYQAHIRWSGPALVENR
ncbi:hypothetical protein, partial [Roseiconus lacunae]